MLFATSVVWRGYCDYRGQLAYMDTQEMVFLLHLLATCWMTAVILLVQLVHYPSFLYIDSTRFVAFERFHCAAISVLVVPAMVVELVTGIVLLFFTSQHFWAYCLGLVLLLCAWVSTFCIQSPLHQKLLARYDPLLIRRLIRSNWLRTVAWSLRLGILSYVAIA